MAKGPPEVLRGWHWAIASAGKRGGVIPSWRPFAKLTRCFFVRFPIGRVLGHEPL